MEFFEFIAEDINTRGMDFGDVDANSVDYENLDGQIEDDSDNGNELLPNEDWSWLDNYIYFGGNHLPENTNLDIDDNTDLDDYNKENDSNTTHEGSKISFTGVGACKCGRCGSFVGCGSNCNICGCEWAAHSRYKK